LFCGKNIEPGKKTFVDWTRGERTSFSTVILVTAKRRVCLSQSCVPTGQEIRRANWNKRLGFGLRPIHGAIQQACWKADPYALGNRPKPANDNHLKTGQ
jgi:hypothetical protein